MKKLIISAIIGVIAVLGVSRLFFSDNKDSKKFAGRNKRQVMAVAVETTRIKLDRLLDKGVFTGTLVAQTEFRLIPKTSGQIKKLHVDTGDKVKNNDVIAELDDEELLLEVKQAQADLEIARANFNESASLLEIAKNELERTQTMRRQKVASDVELEKAQASFKTAQARLQVTKAQLTQKQAALDTANVRLSYAKVDVSWSNGSEVRLIALKFLDEGDMASTNSPIVSVIDIATLTAVIDVVEKDYFKLKVGQNAQIFTDAIPDSVYPAKVVRLSPMLESASRLARVELELSNPDFMLKPGMFITAEIIFEAHESATLVPNSSLVRRNEKQGVFLINNASMTASFVEIKAGFSNEAYTEVLEPAISGDVVILGHHLLENGSPVRIPDLNKDIPQNVDFDKKTGGEQ